MGKHAPIQYLSKKEIELKMNPWLTNGLLKSIKIKTKYYKKFMKTKNKKHYAKYKIYRDKINHLIRASKNIYYKNYFTQYKKNSKKIWDGINNILTNKQKSTNSKINIIENNTFITDQLEVANKFNTFFTNIGPLLSENITDLGHNFSEYLPLPNNNSFFMSPTTPHEIEIELMSLSESKSSDIPIQIIKAGLLSLSVYLDRIYNLSFGKGIYIELLKFATITPVHKGDSKMSLTNYRPISILPIFSKILERLVHKRLMKFLIKNNSIFEHQFGFQPNKTTEMAILDIYAKIVNAPEDKKMRVPRFCQSIRYS